MKKSRRKLKSKQGFTLIEMIMCVITLVMIALICTTGMNIAMKSYNESLFETNSQMLQDTINTALSDLLRNASNVSVETSGGTEFVKFDNKAYGVNKGHLKLGTSTEDNGYIKVVVKDVSGSEEKYLVSRKTYAGNLCIGSFTLRFDSGTGTFTGEYTIVSTVLTGMSRTVQFSYRSIYA